MYAEDGRGPPVLIVWLALLGMSWLLVGFATCCCWAGWKWAEKLLF